MKTIRYLLIIFILLFLPSVCFATDPILFFTDLIDGPNTGLTDDQVTNQGAIVTVWGRNLGSSQGTSTISVGSDGSGWTEAAHVYYWGNADGTSNGTHADLNATLGLQEISFAISSSTATGAQKIKVNVSSTDSNELDFYVREIGSTHIYFVKTTGNDSTGDGSWATPWLTPNKATSGEMITGDIVYVGNGISLSGSYTIDIGSGSRIHGTQNNMCGLIVYPGATVTLTATTGGIRNYFYDNDYWVISKFSVDSDGYGIYGSAYGRIVGNVITGSPETVAFGAIDAGVNNGDTISGIKVLGNHIHNFGSSATGNQEHTTYFRIRSSNAAIPGIEFAWNYLKDNAARFGFHYYDESTIGHFTSACYVHNNWIENQGGSGINIGSGSGDYNATGTWYVYNNVLVNCGLQTDQGVSSNPNAIWIYGVRNFFDIYLYNNVIYGYSQASPIENSDLVSSAISVPSGGTVPFAGTWTFKNNIIVDTNDEPFTNPNYINPTASSNNIWYNGGDSTPASAPAWDTDPITTDPTFTNAATGDFTLQAGSPAYEAGADVSSIVVYSFDGVLRTIPLDIGVYEASIGASVAVTGTALSDFNEDDVVTGGRTLIFTATNTTWAATIGADNAITTAFLAIFDGDKTGAGYWDTEVSLDYTMLTRTSDTVLTLILPATAGYDISATETVSIAAIPATATAFGDTITPSPNSFTIGVVSAGTTTAKTGSYQLGAPTGTYNANGTKIIYGN